MSGDIRASSSSSQGKRPLAGKQVVVTRARAQASELCALIEAQGGLPFEFPVIRIDWPDDLGPLDEAQQRLASFDWILFTSVNGVEMFFDRLQQQGLSFAAAKQARVAAVGPKTALALKQHGVDVAVTAAEFVGEGLVEALGDQVEAGQQILLPRANIARKNLPEALRAKGCVVTEVEAYQNLAVHDQLDELLARLQAGKIDVITFTSASTVRNFVKALEGQDLETLLQGVVLAAIGPVTADAARTRGLHVDVMPDTYTIPVLVDAIIAHLRRREESAR